MTISKSFLEDLRSKGVTADPVIKDIGNARLGQLAYLARETEFRSQAISEIERRILR